MDRRARILVTSDGPGGVRVATAAVEAGYEVYGVRGRWRLPVTYVLGVGARDPVEIAAAAADAGIDVVHPGDGELARDPVLAREVVAAGLGWAGGRIGGLEDAADRLLLRRIARDAGIEVPPADRLAEPEAARSWVRRYGSPLVVRPRDRDGRARARHLPAGADVSAAGPGPWFLERTWPEARNVAVVLLGDGEGDALVVGEVELLGDPVVSTSVMVSPARLSEQDRLAVREAALRFAERAWPLGIAAVRFSVAPKTHLAFVDATSGLPEGWGAVDAAYGVELVQFQLAVCEGDDVGWSDADTRPTRGAVELTVRATGRGEARAKGAGWLIASTPVKVAEDDPVAHAVFEAPTRAAALVRALAGLKELEVQGVPTNATEIEEALVAALA